MTAGRVTGVVESPQAAIAIVVARREIRSVPLIAPVSSGEAAGANGAETEAQTGSPYFLVDHDRHMAAVGVLACAAPARRVLRIQPTEALRQR